MMPSLVIRSNQLLDESDPGIDYYESPKDRFLLDDLIKEAATRYKFLGSSPTDRKMRLMQIATFLLSNDRFRGSKTHKLSVEPKLLKELGGKKAIRALNKLLSDKNFDVKYNYELKHYRSLKQQRELLKQQETNTRKLRQKIAITEEANNEIKTKLKHAHKTNRKLWDKKLDYKPTFQGQPFPPVAIAGLDYHAPMFMNINVKKYPNERAYESTYSRYGHDEIQACKFISNGL